MKNLLLILLVFFAFNVAAQTATDSVQKAVPKVEYEYYGRYKFKLRNNWANLAIGPNFYPDINLTNANINIDYNFHHKKYEKSVFQVGYTNNSFNYILSAGSATYLQTLNFGVGKMKEKRYWKVAGFIGPSLHYTKYYVFDEEKSMAEDKTYGVGLHAEIQLIGKPLYDLGFCINPFADFNGTQTVVGLSFGVYTSNAMVKKLY